MSSRKSKKQLRSEVALTLFNTFSKFNDKISPKKLKRNIKKASKALVAGMKVDNPKKTDDTKEEVIVELVTD